MAENNDILGIGMHFDISDVKQTFEELYSLFRNVQGISENVAKKLEDAFEGVAKATERNISQKTVEAINVFTSAFEEAKKGAEDSVDVISKNLDKLQGNLSALNAQRQGTKLDPALLDEVNGKISETEKQIEAETSAYDAAKKVLENITSAYGAILEKAEEMQGASLLPSNIEESRLAVEELSNTVEAYNSKAKMLFDEIEAIGSGDSVDIGTKQQKLEEYISTLEGMRDATQASVEAQKSYLAELSRELENLKAQITEAQNAGDVSKAEELYEQYNKLSVMFNQGSANLEKFNDALKNIDSNISGATQQINALNGSVSNLGSTIEQSGEKTDSLKQKLVSWATGNGKLQEGIEKFKTGLEKLPIPLRTATEGIGDMVKGLWAMCKTPIGMVLAGITLALQALFSWFTKSAEGQKEFARISAYVGSVLSSLTDIAVKVGKYLFNAFASSNGAMNGFAKGLVTTFKSAVETTVKLVTGLGKSIKGLYQIITGDFKEGWETLKEAGSDMASSIKSAISTVSNSLSTAWEGIKGIARMSQEGISALDTADIMNSLKNIQRAAKESSELAYRQKEAEIAVSKAKEKEAELDAQIAESRERIYTLTGKERLEEIQKLKAMQKQKYEDRIKQYEELYKIQKRTNELHSSTLEDEEKERQLNIQLLQLKAQQAAATRMTARLEESTKRTMMNEGKKGAKQTAAVSKANSALAETIYTNEDARIKIEKELESRISDAKVAAMKEGFEKTLAERKRQNEAELDEIEKQRKAALDAEYKRQKQEYEKEQAVIKAQGGKTTEWDRSMFQQDGFVSKINEYWDKVVEYTKQRQLNDQKQVEKELIRSHQSYTDQRLEIERQYTEDIAMLNEALALRRKQLLKAETDEERGEIQSQIDAIMRSIGQTNKDRLQKKVEVDFAELKEDPTYYQAWSDLKYVSTDTLNNLISLFRKYKKEYSGDPEAMEKWMERIKAMSDEIARRNPFKALLDSRRRLNEISKEKAETEKEIEGLEIAEKNAQSFIENAKFNGWDTRDQEEKLKEIQKRLEEARKKGKDLSDEEIEQQIKYEEALSRTSAAVKGLGSAFNELGNAIGGTQGEILSLIGNVFSFVSTTVDGLKSLSQTASGVIGAIEKASIILTIISAAVQLAKQISELVPDSYGQYEDYRDKVNEINKAAKAVRDYEIAVLKARMAERLWFASSGMNKLSSQWELSSKARDEYFKKLYEWQATYENETGGGWLTKLGGQANKTIANLAGSVNELLGIEDTFVGNMQTKLAQSVWASAVGGPIGMSMNAENELYNKGWDKDYIEGMTRAIHNLRIETRSASSGFLGTGIGGHSQETEDLVEWVRKELGLNLFDAEGWLDEEAYQAIMENYKDQLVGETEATLEALHELKEEHDEFIKQLEEYVREMYSPLIDDMTSAVWDWFDQGKDAMNSFRDYAGKTFRDIATDLVKSRIMEMFGEQFGNRLKALYESYFDKKEISYDVLMLGIADATNEVAEAFAEAQPVLQDTITTLENALNTTGISMKTGNTSDQQATYNSLEKWTYEQADELINRATAGQIILQHLLDDAVAKSESLIGIQAHFMELNGSVASIIEGIGESVSLHTETNTKLDKIITNTNPISEIRDYVKKLYLER